MKLTTHELTRIIPVSTHTVIRYQKDDKCFPKPERIGRVNYFEQSAFFHWLNNRATCGGQAVPPGTICLADKVLSTAQVCEKLNRSSAWLWQNLIKNPKITLLDLSPSGNSQNPRRYFIEREILTEFATLVELAEGQHE